MDGSENERLGNQVLRAKIWSMGGPKRKYQAFGETKLLTEWAKDPRCRIQYATLVQRVRKIGVRTRSLVYGDHGADLEAILSGPQRPGEERLRMVTAFGETKMSSEWAKDPRCTVSLTAICQRLDRGMDPEVAISAPISYIVVQEAFGEFKTISDWALDPRCVVGRSCLGRRLNNGEPLEEAMTRPSRQSTPIRHIPSRPAGYSAFGQFKTLEAWADDPRCVVTFTTLRYRLDAGFDPEVAITQPPKTIKGRFIKQLGKE